MPTRDSAASRTTERLAYFLAGVLAGRIGLYYVFDFWRTDYCAETAQAVIDDEQSMSDPMLHLAHRCLDSIEPRWSPND